MAFSKRQDTLERRAKRAEKILKRTRRAMQSALLTELAKHGVYSVNDLHRVYSLRSTHTTLSNNDDPFSSDDNQK